MLPMQKQSLRSLALVILAGGLLTVSLTGCAAQRRQPTGTAGAPSGAATAANSKPAAGSVTPSSDPADQVDTELQQMVTQLGNADTITDFSTSLPPDAAASTPAAAAPADTAAPAVATSAPNPTVAPSDTTDTEGDQVDQMLSDLLDQLNKTDTVPEAANP
jgi:hypothetical protein